MEYAENRKKGGAAESGSTLVSIGTIINISAVCDVPGRKKI